MSIRRRRPHNKPNLEDAKAALAAALADVLAKIPDDPEIEHSHDRTRAVVRGGQFTAHMVVDTDEVHIEVTLGFLAKLLKGRIEQELDNTLDRHFP